MRNGRSVGERTERVCVFAKTAVNWNGSSQDHQPRPLYDLQFEDLSILERRTSSDVPSVTGPQSRFTAEQLVLVLHVCVLKFYIVL